MNDKTYYTIGEYTFNEMQLRELIDSGIRGDTEYCRSLQELWKVQQSERLSTPDGNTGDESAEKEKRAEEISEYVQRKIENTPD